MKTIKIWVVLIMVLLLFSGCWDAKEIEEQFLVWGMSWDVSKDDPHLLTLNLSSPSTAEGAKEPITVVASTGHSVEEARMNAQAHLYRSIEFGHLRILVIGEDFARKGIQKHLDSLGRNPRVNRKTLIAVVEGRAADIWKLKNPSNPLPVDYVVNLIKTNSQFSRALDFSFRDFFEALSREGKEPVTTYLRMSKDKRTITAFSIAIFKKDKFIGTIDNIEVQIYQMIIGKSKHGTITIGQATWPDEESITFSFRNVFTDVKTEVKDDIPHVYLNLEIEGDLTEQTSLIPAINVQTIKRTERALKARLEREFAKTIDKVQHEFKSDVFGFGEYFRAYYPAYWKSHNWEEEFPRAVVHVKIKVNIRRIGIES
ncbi:hypothetical protein BBF96_12430 [Anoxybacter fermentans]|uniref:Uncharacterized protein n=1 Tax=Anoxybacter fermentans TaxID=1323375 RepID=A0A3Q9HTL5_9FIRM|nr:Ger(x)C family spore germination protein [Anoxybacter fermentans]AZR74134.1 hypothetical protein BBF96_12430 [Anoxybacter fermentans]